MWNELNGGGGRVERCGNRENGVERLEQSGMVEEAYEWLNN